VNTERSLISPCPEARDMERRLVLLVCTMFWLLHFANKMQMVTTVTCDVPISFNYIPLYLLWNFVTTFYEHLKRLSSRTTYHFFV